VSSTEPIQIILKLVKIFERLAIPYVAESRLARALKTDRQLPSQIALMVDLRRDKVSGLFEAITPQFKVTEGAIREAIRAQSGFTLVHKETNIPVNLLLLRDELFWQSLFSRRRPIIVQLNPEKSLWVPSLEDIFLEKLIEYRDGDRNADQVWRDSVWMLKVQNEDLDFEYLREWAIALQAVDIFDRALGEAGFEIL
jgi:hypothetical protein